MRASGDMREYGVAIGCERLPVCGEDGRRERLRASGHLNGIDFVEVGDDGVTLCVHLFGEIPEGIGREHVRITGGDRITGLRVRSVDIDDNPDMHDEACLRIVVDREGDHTPYCLCLVDAAAGDDAPDAWRPYPGFDPRHACVELRFRLGCAQSLDCPMPAPCVESPGKLPDINYLAKDYESFRQLFLDRMAQTMPAWRERHVPDVGIALVEVLAYTADFLSYYQDAVATEAYLGTARKRISVRRHARLVDYCMHEGCNARAFVTLASDTDCILPLQDLLLLVPPPGQRDIQPGVIDADQLEKARADGALVFEPMVRDGRTDIAVVAAHKKIRIHAWGDEMCCLPRGSTRATLVDEANEPEAAPVAPVSQDKPGGHGHDEHDGDDADDGTPARALQLVPGDLLIFEEVLGPQTGVPADADPTHRHAVRLTAVEQTADPLDGTLLVEVRWDACDALPFDLCLSSRRPAPDCRWLPDVSVARGNVLLVDHGEHVHEDDWQVPGTVEYGCCVCEDAVQDIARIPGQSGHRLAASPLTWAEPLPTDAPVCKLLARDPRQALPQVAVHDGVSWEARYDLLGSEADERHFVVEIDDEGAANLRFGDGVRGRQPRAGNVFRAAPRIGNGPVGNVGSDSIVWLAFKANPLSGANLQPRNPLPASGGTTAESIAEAKLFAPGTFRAKPMRAIVADDYAMFAARAPELQGAACAMEWTGSWYEANVVVDPLGRTTLPDALGTRVAGELERYRRIGHDVAVEAGRYVPLLVELFVCVRPGFLVAHVEAELRDRFSSGSRSGFFHPDRLRLGAPVHASAIVAQAQSITGVAHVDVVTLARMENGKAGDVPDDGVLEMGAREIAQLDNDPDHPDRGRITFTTGGGR
jgi:hypothetical protein